MVSPARRLLCHFLPSVHAMADAPAQVVPEPWRGSDSEEEDVLYQKCQCRALRRCEIEAETLFRNERLREHMQTVREEIERKR